MSVSVAIKESLKTTKLELLFRRKATTTKELRQLELAADAKRAELAEINVEKVENKKLKAVLPPLI